MSLAGLAARGSARPSAWSWWEPRMRFRPAAYYRSEVRFGSSSRNRYHPGGSCGAFEDADRLPGIVGQPEVAAAVHAEQAVDCAAAVQHHRAAVKADDRDLSERSVCQDHTFAISGPGRGGNAPQVLHREQSPLARAK